MKQIDAWHEFKFSDRQLQTISPEFQQYGETVLNNTLNLVKTMDRKPSPAKLMSMCKEQQAQLFADRQIESPDEDPSTWMTSKEYARSQGFESLVELIRHKIEMDGGEMSDGLEKAVGDL
tara:strand:+ start:333 stop:692 length:360 start_codon:yes stop_codon:yes gene_type:complete